MPPRLLEASSALDLPTSGRVDLSGLRTVDSSALAVLFALKRRAKAQRRELVFEGDPAGPRVAGARLRRGRHVIGSVGAWRPRNVCIH